MPRSFWNLLALVLFLSPPIGAFADERIDQGKYLTAVAGCAGCHTAPGGEPFAGGLSLTTPFGKLITPNITPDRQTGIGDWTDEQFVTLLHEGRGKDGEHIYPAMPYNYYTKMTRDDALAIRAYLASLPPVRSEHEVNQLPFPFNVRTSLVAWKAMFFESERFQPDPDQSPEVNRGEYLVDALSHCGACHTPRNALGGSESYASLQGAETPDGWYAPNLSSSLDGLGSWSPEELATFLRTGAAPPEDGGASPSVAIGPMSQVVHESTRHLTDPDLRAMVAYLKSVQPRDTDQEVPQAYAGAAPPGGAAYLSYCAGCHGVDGKGVEGAIPALAGNGAVTSEGPQNVINVLIGGLAASGDRAPMPAFGGNLSNDEIAEITNYVRTAWGNEAEPNASPGLVGERRVEIPVALTGDQPACYVGGEAGAGGQSPEGSSTAVVRPGPEVLALMREIDGSTIYQQVGAVVDRVKASEPDRPRAEIVNGLALAYCEQLLAAPEPTLREKRQLFHRFQQLVYTRLASPTASLSR